ncbi:HAD family hydrolase [Couchioplanes caeruleus]|uniref:Haloacid dehalogenase n=2 Tax=Couchioplanes caeruleus TaxID=56438 RepID=A0A1K0FT47_9ACTN|nr:haloacid dehalogenase-like hydrolase [Couchioplanes caeruleus]OJF11215.1 haloacid dehalogenase [Couchioplanes caeruleus subsp. caeruleus]OJF15981.1 haloacid dehalogenase [Couchioplanes caeruleus subsp. caeruleus]ROP27837.1 phosphoglycolate phosphatase-like HAD superfamily hydrolase [Couchioplanes caeruleus]
MEARNRGVVVWDVDGTLIPADLRWLRRSIARTFEIAEASITFPATKVHGYTDESIVVDTAIASGIPAGEAEAGIARFHDVLAEVMSAGREELARVQPPYPGARETITRLHERGFVQTVLTGNLRAAAEIKLATLGLRDEIDREIGAFGSDERDRFRLPEVIARRYEKAYGHRLVPHRTVIVGDAPNDIACARHAGFRAVVVAHRATREELSAHEPDAILDDLDPDVAVPAVSMLAVDGRE